MTSQPLPSHDEIDSGLIELVEEFARRLQQGETLDADSFLAAHPEHAERLRPLLPAVRGLARLGESADAPGCGALPLGEAGEGGQLGDYRIIRRVGQGGMGVVFEAVQQSLGRHVALKVLPASSVQSPSLLERFKREAQAAARLHHTNIVPVFGVGEAAGVHFYAMQFIRGRGLDRVIAEEGRVSADLPPADPAQTDAQLSPGSTAVGSGASKPASGSLGKDRFRAAARLGVQAAEALAHAHSQGVLHRDIKPSNLLLDDQGTVWVADFGLARVEGLGELTGTGEVVGTLRYLPPERLRGQGDARSDVYSLGLTLYELLTLRPALDAPDQPRLIEQLLHRSPPAPRRIDPRIAADLETIVLKAIDKEPARRYQSAAEMANDLEAFLADRPIKARPLAWWQQAAKWARRRPAVAALSSVLLATALVGLALVLWQARRATRGWQDAELGWAAEKRERVAKELALQEKERALEQAGTSLYRRNVSLADLHWWANRVAQADELLDECPEDRRSWEWNYLARRCRSYLLALEVPGCRHVRFSDDGRRLAILAERPDQRLQDRKTTVDIRDATTGRLERTFTLPGFVRGIGAGGAALLVATAVAPGGECQVSDCWTGRRLGALPSGARLLFHPEGRLVGAADPAGGVFRTWDIASGKEVGSVALPAGSPINVQGYSPDGSHLLVFAALPDQAERFQVLDARTGKRLRALAGEQNALGRFAPSGARVALSGGAGPMRVCDALTGKTLHTLADVHSSGGLVFSSDSSRLATAAPGGAVTVWHADTGRELARIRGHGRQVTDLAFDPAGDRLASCDTGGRVFIHDVLARQAGLMRTLPGTSRALVVSPDGRRLARVAAGQLHVQAALSLRDLVGPVPAPPGAALLAFSPDGDRLAAAFSNGTVLVWDGATLRALESKPASPTALAFAPDGRRLACAFAGRDGIDVWDVSAGQRLRTLPRRGGSIGLAFAEDGQLASASSGQGGIDLWDVDTGRRLATLTAEDRLSGAVRFAPDGRVAAFSRDRRTLLVWDATIGAAARKLVLPAPGTAFAFEPAGKRLAVGAEDGSLLLCDPAAADEPRSLPRHESAVGHLAFHPSGTRLATSYAGGVKLHDVRRAQELLELPLPNSTAVTFHLAFVGDELVAGIYNSGQRILRWDGRPVRSPRR